MKTYSTIFVILLLIYTLFFYIRAKICIHKIKEDKKLKDNIKEKNNKIIIAIPVLREQKCIEDTIEYFSKITKDIPIIIVTTQKEIKENIDNEVSTQDIVKNNILPKYKDVYWIDYPYENGYMANQLNYMLDNLEEILKQKINFENTYLALYNADSKPNENTFEEIKNEIRNGREVIQQYSYCMKNYNELNNILKGFSIYQSNFELKTGFINSFLKSKFLYTHVLGHGLIIKLKTLKTLNNFNTNFWCEDIYLGLQLKFNNIEIQPLITLENIETPNSIESLIKQNSVWFKTTSQFFKIYKDVLKNNKASNKLNGIIGCLNEFRCAVNWLGFPICLLFSLIGTIIIKNYVLFLAVIISYLLYVSVNTIMTVKLINILDKKDYKVNVNMILNTAIATAMSNFGPIYSIIDNKKEKYKTER